MGVTKSYTAESTCIKIICHQRDLGMDDQYLEGSVTTTVQVQHIVIHTVQPRPLLCIQLLPLPFQSPKNSVIGLLFM